MLITSTFPIYYLTTYCMYISLIMNASCDYERIQKKYVYIKENGHNWVIMLTCFRLKMATSCTINLSQILLL